MSSKDKNDKGTDAQGGETEGDSGKGGKGGAIEFRDFLAPERLRDDLLPADEKKRLLIVHRETHEIRVKKQKEQSEIRKALKEGRIPPQAYQQGLRQGDRPYKVHPISLKAQFSGIDRQVIALPTEHIAETNQEKKEELQYQYNLHYQPEMARRYIPKLTRR